MDTELYRVSAMHQVPAPRLFVSYKKSLDIKQLGGLSVLDLRVP